MKYYLQYICCRGDFRSLTYWMVLICIIISPQMLSGQVGVDNQNHYKTWMVQPQTYQTRVLVEDQFMEDSLTLIARLFLSNPTLKIHGAQTFPILNPDNHLTWYQALGRDTSINLSYKNQVESTTVTINHVQFLLVPTQKQGHNPPTNLDHYKAYQIMNPQMLQIPVMLSDQFDVRYGLPENIDSLFPAFFLTPAIKNKESQLSDSITHYVAYQIFPPRAVDPLTWEYMTVDQFGVHYLQIMNSTFLLVPSEKYLPTPPPTDTLKNHYKTWRTSDEPFSAIVSARDQFMTDSLQLSGLRFLSNPAEKTHGSFDFKIKDSLAHLTWYQADGKPANLNVTYINQFESTAVTIDSVRYLLVPTQKLPHDPPVNLDHYKSYRITDGKGFRVPIVLQDQFDVLRGMPEYIDSLVPRYFLTPTVKNNEQQMLHDSLTHYVAYEIFPESGGTFEAYTADQFGQHTLYAIYSQYVLVPSVKLSYYSVDTLGSIGGIKYEDLNGNGMFDPGEPGLPGWSINIAGPVPGATITGPGGAYSFTNLPAGNYTVSEVLQAGWIQTAPAPPGTYTINLLAGQDVVGVDFGNDSTGSINGSKFNDIDRDGQWDPGEPGLAGWVIKYSGPTNGLAVTGPGGTYSINMLPPGVYTVSESVQIGWTQSMPVQPGTYNVTISSRLIMAGIDFGNWQSPTPGSRKDHYKTWMITPQQFNTKVRVQDQFMTDSLQLVEVDFLSNPTKKIHGLDTFEITKPTNHLTWYSAEGDHVNLTIQYSNQFESTSVSIDSVKYLLVPTQKLPHAPPESLDHYKAYRILNSMAIPTSIMLWDQFDDLLGVGDHIDLLTPKYFLTPASKNMEQVFDSITYYVAYEIQPKRVFQYPRNTVDQFGEHVLTILNSDLLLVPTTKYSVTPSINSLSIPFDDGWNMLSVPFQVSDFSKVVLFPTAVSNAFTYTTSYVIRDTLEMGVGYWLKFSDTGHVDLEGTQCEPETVTVSAGWNMIGSVSTPLAISSITSIPGGIITSDFFGYNGTYFTADTIKPGRAYWVKVSAGGKLLLSASVALGSANRINIIPTGEVPPLPPEGSDRKLQSGIPNQFELEQNYPNPFNPITSIHYSIPIDCWVSVKIFNLLGQEVAVLVAGHQDAGYKAIEFDAQTMPSGIYTYQLKAGDHLISKKMILLR